MRKILSLALANFLILPAAANAQSDEIIVTAARISSSDYEQPHVVMKRRPDNVILSVSVVCDTRDAKLRLTELEKTMQDVVLKARNQSAIELGYLVEREDDQGNDITFVKSYEQSKFGEYVTGGSRSDTSAINLVLKTRVVDEYETEEDALNVLRGFMESVKTSGRTEVIETDDPILSIINPMQYRYDIVRNIAADANKVAAAFGGDYRVEVDGLEAPMVFYQTGELELTLYIPYGFDVVPPK